MLYFADQPLPAYFHAASGGQTEALSTIWPDRRCPDGVTDPSPCFPAQEDPFATAGVDLAPQRLGAWQTRLSWSTLAAALARGGRAAIEPQAFNWEPTLGCRAGRISVQTASGIIEIGAHELRMLVGPREIRSTCWTAVDHDARGVQISGLGFGHGVGMPQASAWAMAHAGYGAPQILARYYPAATVVARYGP
jgi:SpoIID/LytB domain protein